MNELDEFKAFLLKIIMPALVALSMKIAIMSKDRRMTVFEIATTIIAGGGAAYLTGPYVMETFPDRYIPLAVAIITISGERIGHWLIYKFNVEMVLKDIIKKYSK
jgi:hypothetical protein